MFCLFSIVVFFVSFIFRLISGVWVFYCMLYCVVISPLMMKIFHSCIKRYRYWEKCFEGFQFLQTFLSLERKKKVWAGTSSLIWEFESFIYKLCLPHLGLGDVLFLPGSSVHPSVCLSQNRIRSVTWKPFKISSWNFIQILTNIRWRAERNNHNSCVYTFWVMPLWTV